MWNFTYISNTRVLCGRCSALILHFPIQTLNKHIKLKQ